MTRKYVSLGSKGEDFYPKCFVFKILISHLEQIKFHVCPCHTGVLYLVWSVITLKTAEL